MSAVRTNDSLIVGRAVRTARLWSAVGVAVVSVAIAWLARLGPDWPAQEFRAWIADHDGLSVLTTRWYGGSALPGYSVLYPVITAAFPNAVVAAALVGVVSCVAATWAAFAFSPASGTVRSVTYGLAVAVSVCENLLIGQIPFLLGAAFGLGAVTLVIRRRAWAGAALLACLASLASPLAGVFVILVAPAIAVTTGWRKALPLSAAVTGTGVALVGGGASGPFPFPWQTFLGVVGFCVAVWFVGRGRGRAIQTFALCYLGFALLTFAVPNPIGGNAARLAKIIAVPLACLLLRTRTQWPRAVVVVLASAAVAWPGVAFVSSAATGAADPARQPSFYSGLLRFLRAQPAGGRLEIPFTDGHWESYFVARRYPIARGWERQSDLEYNSVLYAPLTAARYHSWLMHNAITLVALPRAPLDTGGRAEAALLKRPPRYLVPVWHDANWRVWRVVHPTPLVTGAARLTDEDPSSLALRFARPGVAIVHLHASPLWTDQTSGSCVKPTPKGWLAVRSNHSGTVDLAAMITSHLITGSSSCGP